MSETERYNTDQETTDWWARWFNTTYSEVYSHRDERSAQAEVRFAIERLCLEPSHRILDLCCGNGRHSRAFWMSGFKQTVGVDYSWALLGQAKNRFQCSALIRGDMRELPIPDHSLDAVVMFFTSFGYFATEVEDRRVIEELARVLKPQGAYLIDYLNASYIRANLVPRSRRQVGNRRIFEERSLSRDGNRVEKTIVIEANGEEQCYRESVRLYEREAMIALLGSVGIAPLTIYGDFTGAPWALDRPRTLLVRPYTRA